MLKGKLLLWVAPLLVASPVFTSNALAQNRQMQPEYLQALSDLRYARANLDVNSYPDVTPQTQKAVKEIDDTIGELKQALIDDHKSLTDHLPVDTAKKPHERFQDAIAALNKAHTEVAQAHEDPQARELRRKALDNIDAARINAKQAMDKARADWEREQHGKH